MYRGKLIDGHFGSFIRLFLGVQASYSAIMMAELTSLCLSTTLLIAIYQVSELNQMHSTMPALA